MADFESFSLSEIRDLHVARAYGNFVFSTNFYRFLRKTWNNHSFSVIKSSKFPAMLLLAKISSLDDLPIPGGHLLERMTGESDTFKLPFFVVFVRSGSGFSHCLSAQGPIFRFLSMLGHILFSFSTLRGH